MTRLVLGGYGRALGVVELGPDGFGSATEVAPADRPSFVVVSPDGRFVYATLETAQGHVGAWAVGEFWRALGEQPTGGADPCHLALSPDGRWLVTANYTSGSVCVHPVHADGSLGERTDLVQHQGDPGPVADRQDGPHAHQVVFVDDTHLLVCDLGLDAVVAYRLGTDGRLTELARSAMPPGSGPRHLVLAGDRAYVLGELDSTVTTCEVDGLRLTSTESVSTRATDAKGENTGGEIVVTPDTVLASNRGDNTVAVLRRAEGGLQPGELVRSGGSWPRWIGVVADVLLVADQRSDRVTALRRSADGWAPVATVEWPTPTCVAVLD